MAKTMKIDESGTHVGDMESTGMDSLSQGTSQFGLGLIMTLAALIGVWGVACLIGGIAKCEGILDLVRGYFTAVMGM